MAVIRWPPLSECRHSPAGQWIKDAVTADGDIKVPIDAEAFGFWLKAAFGAPVTTGTTNKTHTFKSGNWNLPSMAIEVAMLEIPRFAMYTGCVLDQISWQMQRSGLLTADAKLIAQGENVVTTTPAATDQSIGTGDGATTAFQLVKAYTSGAQSWARMITKPVASSVVVADNGV